MTSRIYVTIGAISTACPLAPSWKSGRALVAVGVSDHDIKVLLHPSEELEGHVE